MSFIYIYEWNPACRVIVCSPITAQPPPRRKVNTGATGWRKAPYHQKFRRIKKLRKIMWKLFMEWIRFIIRFFTLPRHHQYILASCRILESWIEVKYKVSWGIAIEKNGTFYDPQWILVLSLKWISERYHFLSPFSTNFISRLFTEVLLITLSVSATFPFDVLSSV